ncbi:MAG: helix-turn-helix domain-containing protein [Coriobacteriales bacterium]|nr:helix-turn-helix domain-containing protein [Coriobacteriales bacterium]
MSNVAQGIKSLRVERGWSQEQMAERLGVSRQAITKWETGAGAPDIENLAAIARLFGVSTDSLLFGDKVAEGGQQSDCFESITSVDMPAEKHYDISVGCARSVSLFVTDSEKVTVRLEAKSIADLERAFKVILDTEGRNFEVNVQNTGIVADVLARKELDVTIGLPAAYSADAEIELFADELHVENAALDLEVGGKVGRVWITNTEGHIELDVSVDMEVWADGVTGRLDVNQVGATSVLHIAHDAPFVAATRGRLGKRTLRYTRNGEPAEAPTATEAPLAIELAGARCELTVDSQS